MSGAMAPLSLGQGALRPAVTPARCARPQSGTGGKRKVRSGGGGGGGALGFGGRRKTPSWKCVEGCGACCKLDKGPGFPTPEEIFPHSPDVELYRSMMGRDGWCIHYDKSTRTCSIYADRPYFCRVEPDIFETLYGIEKKKFDKEACSFCRDTIKSIYGTQSTELKDFNLATRNTS